MAKKEEMEVSISYHDDCVVIMKWEPFDILRLTYDEFEEMAYKIRQSGFGK